MQETRQRRIYLAMADYFQQKHRRQGRSQKQEAIRKREVIEQLNLLQREADNGISV